MIKVVMLFFAAFMLMSCSSRKKQIKIIRNEIFGVSKESDYYYIDSIKNKLLIASSGSILSETNFDVILIDSTNGFITVKDTNNSSKTISGTISFFLDNIMFITHVKTKEKNRRRIYSMKSDSFLKEVIIPYENVRKVIATDSFLAVDCPEGSSYDCYLFKSDLLNFEYDTLFSRHYGYSSLQILKSLSSTSILCAGTKGNNTSKSDFLVYSFINKKFKKVLSFDSDNDIINVISPQYNVGIESKVRLHLFRVSESGQVQLKKDIVLPYRVSNISDAYIEDSFCIINGIREGEYGQDAAHLWITIDGGLNWQEIKGEQLVDNRFGSLYLIKDGMISKCTVVVN